MAHGSIKSTQLKVLEGNRSKRKLPQNEPKPRPKAPLCPQNVHKRAKKIWKKLGPKLEKEGLLCEVDGPSFAHFCEIQARLEIIREYLNKENKALVQEVQKPDPDGGMRHEYTPSPYVSMELRYLKEFRSFAKEFGLTPRGRVGLSTGGTNKRKRKDLLSK
jgi:P27 family predicted phage terminase small subunit